SAAISLIDREPFPCQVGASWDWNKVVRADYTDILYMEKALEAKKIWRSDPLFKPFYHESGMIWISDTNFARTVVDNYRCLKAEEEFQLFIPKEARKLYNGM